MTLKQRIETEVKSSLKAGDKERVSLLRMLKARVLEKEVELRIRKGRDYQLNDEEALEVIAGYAKQRRQSIDSYRQAGREDLAKQEERELSMLEDYLPRRLSRREIEEIVERVLKDTGATGPKDTGTAMKAVMPQVKGTADGKLVSEIVREKLG